MTVVEMLALAGPATPFDLVTLSATLWNDGSLNVPANASRIWLSAALRAGVTLGWTPTTWEVGLESQDTGWTGTGAITQPTTQPTAVSATSGSWGSQIILSIDNTLGFGGKASTPSTAQRYIFWARITAPRPSAWAPLATGGVYVYDAQIPANVATAYQPDGVTVIAT